MTGGCAARRCSLSVPASSERMVAKARSLAVDEVILDLEDAVVPEAKDEARARVIEAAAQPGWAAGRLAVRVNAPSTPWGDRDLAAIAGAGSGSGSAIASIIVPKVEVPGDLAFVERRLDGTALGVQALIESAAGLQRVAEIAASSPRLEALVLGYADLGASLGRTQAGARDLDLWAPAQHAVLMAARASALQAIDGPWLGTAVDDAFAAAAQRACDLGFDGKWAIHPAQTSTIQELFTPAADEVAWARDVLAALDAAGALGAVALDGQMLDEAVAVAARRVLARAGELA